MNERRFHVLTLPGSTWATPDHFVDWDPSRPVDGSFSPDLVGSLDEAGSTDVGLHHPTDPGQVEAFEEVAADVLPTLR